MSDTPAILRLEDFAALRVSGEDRRDFLQGQLSQDMDRVTAERAAPAAWCNRQGRVLCLMAAVEWNDATFLVLPAGMAEDCAKGLGRYVLRAKVRIEPSGLPVWGCVNAAGLLGARASCPRRGLEALAPGEAAVPGEGIAPGAAWACSGNTGWCAVLLPGRESRALLLGEPLGDLADAADAGWTAARWRLADIAAELPWIGPATSGKFLAHSLNLDSSGAVSFSKGCYVGQEIIARMQYRGKPKRRMRRLELPPETQAQPGERIQHPELGAATLIAAAPAGGHIEALAEVRLAEQHTGDT